MDSISLPSPPDILDAHELAILAALEVVLDLTLSTFMVEYPEITDGDAVVESVIPYPPRWVAAAIVAQADALLDTVRRYPQARAELDRYMATNPPKRSNPGF
jgi:hypothetical protein